MASPSTFHPRKTRVVKECETAEQCLQESGSNAALPVKPDGSSSVDPTTRATIFRSRESRMEPWPSSSQPPDATSRRLSFPRSLPGRGSARFSLRLKEGSWGHWIVRVSLDPGRVRFRATLNAAGVARQWAPGQLDTDLFGLEGRSMMYLQRVRSACCPGRRVSRQKNKSRQCRCSGVAH